MNRKDLDELPVGTIIEYENYTYKYGIVFDAHYFPQLSPNLKSPNGNRGVLLIGDSTDSTQLAMGMLDRDYETIGLLKVARHFEKLLESSAYTKEIIDRDL